MKLLMTTGLLGLLLVNSASAEVKDGAEIAAAAQRCWALVDLEMTKGFSAKFDARVDQWGMTDFRVRSYLPKTSTGEYMAEAAKRTLLKCSPYKIAPGLYQFEMTYKDPFDNG